MYEYNTCMQAVIHIKGNIIMLLLLLYASIYLFILVVCPSNDRPFLKLNFVDVLIDVYYKENGRFTFFF
jgi:hypothetical protein